MLNSLIRIHNNCLPKHLTLALQLFLRRRKLLNHFKVHRVFKSVVFAQNILHRMQRNDCVCVCVLFTSDRVNFA